MTDRNITRRSVVKAGAWSVPVIAVATAVPHAAASTTGDWTLIRVRTALVEMSRNLGVSIWVDGAAKDALEATTWELSLNGSPWIPSLVRNLHQYDDVWVVPFNGPWPLDPAEPVDGFEITVDAVAHTPYGVKVISEVTQLQLV